MYVYMHINKPTHIKEEQITTLVRAYMCERESISVRVVRQRDLALDLLEAVDAGEGHASVLEQLLTGVDEARAEVLTNHLHEDHPHFLP